MFVCSEPITHKALAGYDITTVFPLFRTNLMGEFSAKRHSNLSATFAQCLRDNVGVELSDELTAASYRSSPACFGYLYATLWSSGYRDRYAQQLKSNYPRVPVTRDLSLFDSLSGLGLRMSAAHLLQRGAVTAAVGRIEDRVPLGAFT